MSIRVRLQASKPVEGFTLVEVMVSVTLVSVVAAYLVHMQIQQFQERIAESVAQDVLMLANVAITYYSQTSEWPGQEEEDCDDLVQTMADLGVYPIGDGGYSGMEGVSLQTDCPESDDVGRVLQIEVVFPFGSDDQARMLHGYLPSSIRQKETNDEPARVLHYVPAPRKASGRFQFHSIEVGDYGNFDLPKPQCPGGKSKPERIVIPQAICVPGLDHGLGGYFVEQLGETVGADGKWILKLKVANGMDNSKSYDFIDLGLNPSCPGPTPIKVGAITYCANE